MSCCGTKKPKTLSPPRTQPPRNRPENHPQSENVKHEILLSIPFCKVHLVDRGEAVEIADGDFTIVQISDEGVLLATIIKVGDHLQWPLTKDEPVVKLDPLHYLFSLPLLRDSNPLSYGVSFSEKINGKSFELLDTFLKEHSCFSTSKSSRNSNIDWTEFAPKIDAYNNVLAKAIAGGTGQIVKGIFHCSNAYTNQVQKGGEMMLTWAVEDKNGVSTNTNNKSNGATNNNGVNKSLKSVRNLSEMTESMSKRMLNGVGVASGSVMGPVLHSQAGKAFFSFVPGEVLLASLDALNKVMDAAEAAQKQTLAATSGAATRMVSQRFGESAGEATGDVLATAGNFAGTAWNVAKIRKSINPASSFSNALLKNPPKTSSS